MKVSTRINLAMLQISLVPNPSRDRSRQVGLPSRGFSLHRNGILLGGLMIIHGLNTASWLGVPFTGIRIFRCEISKPSKLAYAYSNREKNKINYLRSLTLQTILSIATNYDEGRINRYQICD